MKIDRRLKYHACGPDWAHCPACDGRIHHSDCTSRKNPKIDCCPERHKQLYNAGNIRGLNDSSLIMWHPQHPFGCHHSELTDQKEL